MIVHHVPVQGEGGDAQSVNLKLLHTAFEVTYLGGVTEVRVKPTSDGFLAWNVFSPENRYFQAYGQTPEEAASRVVLAVFELESEEERGERTPGLRNGTLLHRRVWDDQIQPGYPSGLQQ